MEIKVNSSELLRKITPLSLVVSKNQTLPVLESVLFNCSTGRLSITASDFETTSIIDVEADVVERGGICVPISIIINTIKTIKDQEIVIKSDEEFNVIIKTLGGEYKCHGYNPNDYPQTPSISSSDNIVLDSETISNAIGKTIICVLNDQLRPAMNGIMFEFVNDVLNVVATDAHRLASITIQRELGDDASFILPTKAARYIKETVQGSVTISYGGNYVSFKSDNGTILARVIDQRFPNYRAVLPQDNHVEVVVNRDAIVSAIKRSIIYANETTSCVSVNINKENITIKSIDVDMARQAKDTISCECNTEEEQTISFNGKMLLEILGSIKDEKIKITMKEPKRASLIYGEDMNLFYLLMPVLTQ